MIRHERAIFTINRETTALRAVALLPTALPRGGTCGRQRTVEVVDHQCPGLQHRDGFEDTEDRDVPGLSGGSVAVLRELRMDAVLNQQQSVFATEAADPVEIQWNVQVMMPGHRRRTFRPGRLGTQAVRMGNRLEGSSIRSVNAGDKTHLSPLCQRDRARCRAGADAFFRGGKHLQDQVRVAHSRALGRVVQ